jgi:acyl carrier protein
MCSVRDQILDIVNTHIPAYDLGESIRYNGVDSLTFHEFRMDIEETFEIDIISMAAASDKDATLGQLVDEVELLVVAKAT